MKKGKLTNTHLRRLIGELEELSKKEKVNNWKRVAKDLSKSARQRREVNVYKINKCAKKGETVVVPGKVLALGEVDHEVSVAAWNFSEIAKKKISVKGKALDIQELMKTNPKGKGVRIIG